MNINRFFKYIIPPGIIELRNLHLRTKQNRLKHSEFINENIKCNFHENIELKDSAKNKRAFIIATGPSIKLQDLSLLANEDCFTVSNAFLHDQISVIKPKFHFFAPFHEPLVKENFADWLLQADNILPSSTNIILGHTDYDLIKNNSLFLSRKTRYLYIDNNIPLTDYAFDVTMPISGFQTGPQMIFPVLFYMGYSEIYLVGCDHDNLLYYNKVRANFYETKQDIRINALGSHLWSGIINTLKNQLNVFQKYEIINDYCLKNGIKLFNLSPNSWLDFIEKKDFDKLLKK